MGDTLVAPTDRYTSLQLAEMLGVSRTTVGRWALWLSYRPLRRGRPSYQRSFTETDLLICRAWQVICGEKAASHNPLERDLCAQAAAAIRRRPARWLVVTPGCGFTYDEAEDATRIAVQLGLSCWWLIDLRSRRD